MKKILIITSAIALASCQTANDPLTGQQQKNNTVAGATLGGLAGAVTGLLVAKNKSGKDKRKSALIGAGIGAIVGGGIGSYMDRQEQELRQQLANSGVSVSRSGDVIILNMPGNVTFATDDASLSPVFFSVLDSVAIVLAKYPKTLLDVDGHTDNTGGYGHNQTLSEQRALSVGQYINKRGVDGRRLRVVGFGETQPIAENSTDYGRAQNRRVEIRIAPLQA
ncbi:MAG: OmpA family protein [Hyphomicrobiales bacterium]|nr:OmpA family protein [Hyphomicrobiales bacterium]